jgi:catechol 2,3-dioxygenase-like lactoylglutathione lyase family enzyme
MSTTDKIEARRARLKELVVTGSTTSTAGVNHIAVISADLEASVRFYREVLGMPLVSVAANRDLPESTHVDVDIGGGTRLSIFDSPHLQGRKAVEGAGGLMHIALSLSRERLEEVERASSDRGRGLCAPARPRPRVP